jgi:hypothetical protein
MTAKKSQRGGRLTPQKKQKKHATKNAMRR